MYFCSYPLRSSAAGKSGYNYDNGSVNVNFASTLDIFGTIKVTKHPQFKREEKIMLFPTSPSTQHQILPPTLLLILKIDTKSQ